MPEIESDLLRATIVPEFGAGLGGLWFRAPTGVATPILRPAPPEVRWFNDLGSYLLAPWSNRIAGARFGWEESEVRLAPDWPDGTAIHGLVKDKQWEVVACKRHLVRLRFTTPAGQWPWSFESETAYGVYDPGPGNPAATFVNSLTLRNTSDRAMPCGIGFHPFFSRAGEQRETVLFVQGLQRYPLEAVMPTGPAAEDDLCRQLARGLRLEEHRLDEVFRGSCRGGSIVWPRLGLSVRIDCSANLGHTVLYSAGPEPAPRQAESFCLEPVSMLNNGFRLFAEGWPDTGVNILQPGETLEGWWSLQIATFNR